MKEKKKATEFLSNNPTGLCHFLEYEPNKGRNRQLKESTNVISYEIQNIDSSFFELKERAVRNLMLHKKIEFHAKLEKASRISNTLVTFLIILICGEKLDLTPSAFISWGRTIPDVGCFTQVHDFNLCQVLLNFPIDHTAPIMAVSSSHMKHAGHPEIT